jgi:endonuclease/exonuclease/phosphatase family metal-dependent hydrolase
MALNQLFVSEKRTYKNLDRIAALLEEVDADIVALQEVDAASKWSGKFDHVQYLVDSTDYFCFVHGRHARSWLYSYGTALLSKSSLAEARSIDFAPSPPTTNKGFVTANFNWSVYGKNIPVTIVSVHLDYSRKNVRDSQIEEMIAALADHDSQLIIMGDLNSGWTDKRPHVRNLAEGLGLEVYDPESADLGTYKSTAGKRLDWILLSPRLEIIEYKVLPDVVSDHLLVYAEIRYRGG